MRGKTHTKVYPTVIRYRERHPMVSFRIPKAEYDELKQEAKKSGITLTELARERVREASKQKEAQERGIKERYEKGYKEGYDKGFDEGYGIGYDEGYDSGEELTERNIKERIKEAKKEGIKLGLTEGRKEFEIKYPCAVCGKMMTMYPNENDHKAMQELMVLNGWKHTNCEE